MGSYASMYADGDIPRENYSSLTGSGWAYYRAQIAGRCTGCKVPTNYWYVTIKSKGKYWCVGCYKTQKEQAAKKLAVYAHGYGAIEHSSS